MKMRNTAISFVLAAAFTTFTAGAAAAAVVSGLYNTGVGVGGAALAAGDNQTDANYTLVAGTIPGVLTGAPARTYYNAAYAAENPGSRWVSYSGSPFSGVGTFDVTTSFDLTGYDLATAQITGLWGVDNEGTIFLNGISTGISLLGTVTANFNVLHSFSITSGFQSGINTLSVRVNDTGSPAAVRFDNLVLSADMVPEPATWAMLVGGFGLVGVASRRRSRAVAA